MSSRFAGKTGVVMAGGHGIGAACAERLAAEGAAVVVVDLNERAAFSTVDAITQHGGRARAVVADAADERIVSELAAGVAQHEGRLDVLVNNAGHLRPGTVLTQTLEEWDRTFAVNVRSMFLATRALLPLMLDTGGGAIVNTGSTAGIVGEPEIAAYGASKGAVVNFTRQLAADFSRQGVRVNCVCPGWVPTGFNDPFLRQMSDEEVKDMVARQVPLGRQGTPAEIAAAVLFLASDEASFVVGQVLGVDGGVSACR